eukprot:g6117.t1
MEETFEAIVNDLPQSCSSMVPGAKEAMAMASDKAQEKLLEMKQKVMAFLKVANTAKSMMTRLLQSFDLLKALIVVVPMVPLILMGLWILTIGIATVISWQSSNPHVAERADDLVIRFGAGGACCAMLVASFVSAAYLFAGIVTGGLCMHLDTNVISLVTVVNFTDVSQFKFDIDPILEGAAKYYVLGSQDFAMQQLHENPMISMIEDVERDAVALYGVYENATWATTPAEMVCSGIKKLNASDALTACSKSVQFARELMSAKNMYPYYQTFAHELMCDKMLHGMKLLILYTIIVSMILMPLVALCADVDLRKWERKVQVTVEVRAVSGSCLGILEMSTNNTIADVKAKLQAGTAGRYDLASSQGHVIPETTDLVSLQGSEAGHVLLCLVWRRLGFAYTADLNGVLTLWDLAQREVVHRLQCSLCQPACPTCLFADWERQRVLCCLEDGTLYLWGSTEIDGSPHLLRIMQDRNRICHIDLVSQGALLSRMEAWLSASGDLLGYM